MNVFLKQYLLKLISKSIISVFHDTEGSDYIIPAEGFNKIIKIIFPNLSDDIEELLEEEFTISCDYFIDSTTPYGSYSLEYGGTVLYSATSPMFDRPKNAVARDLIMLAQSCSKKIIKQQQMAQQRNMILNMAQNSQYSN